MRLIDYFDKPKIIGIIADINEGKSNLIYYLINSLKENYTFKLATFGLKFKIPNSREINSIEELEIIKDSVIFIDEYFSLFDLDDRKKKTRIERTLRLLHHKNNILVLAGVPENFKKFIASKITVCFYKKVKINDFINGCNVKNIITSYMGAEMGSSVLNLGVDEVLVFDGEYKKYNVPYIIDKDSKINNKDIFVQKKCAENVGFEA